MACTFLTLAPADTSGGALSIPVAANGGAEKERDHTIGEMTRSWNGAGRSTVQAVKWRWNITTPPLTEVDADAIRSVLTPGMSYDVGGSVMGGTPTVECYVDLMSERYIAVPAGHMVALTLLVREK